MQLVTPRNVINISFFTILAKGINLYVDLKIVASAEILSQRAVKTKNNLPTNLWARMQLVTPTNVINPSFSNILAKGLNLYVDLKIVASADKENIIRQKIVDKKYYICGRGCKPSRPQM